MDVHISLVEFFFIVGTNRKSFCSDYPFFSRNSTLIRSWLGTIVLNIYDLFFKINSSNIKLLVFVRTEMPAEWVSLSILMAPNPTRSFWTPESSANGKLTEKEENSVSHVLYRPFCAHSWYRSVSRSMDVPVSYLCPFGAPILLILKNCINSIKCGKIMRCTEMHFDTLSVRCIF